jgi:hypothetical protein
MVGIAATVGGGGGALVTMGIGGVSSGGGGGGMFTVVCVGRGVAVTATGGCDGADIALLTK